MLANIPVRHRTHNLQTPKMDGSNPRASLQHTPNGLKARNACLGKFEQRFEHHWGQASEAVDLSITSLNLYY